MAETNKKISITLTLEGQNFIVGMNGATVATAKLSAELPKITPATKALTGSLDDLNERLAAARTRFSALTKESPGYEAALKRVQVLQQHVRNSTVEMSKPIAKSGQDLSKFGAASGNVGFAVLNMNRVISDAPWGFIAISNNIEPLFNSMQMVVQRSGSVKAAMITLAKSFMGPLGITTAVALATAALTYFTLNSSKTKEKTKELTTNVGELEEKARTLAATYQDLVKLDGNYRASLIATNIALQENILANLERMKLAMQSSGSEDSTIFDAKIESATKKLNEYNKQLNEGNKYTNENIALIKELANVAANQGSEGIKKFAVNNKLSEGQLSNLSTILKDYKVNIMSVAGGLAKELPDGMREFGIKLGLQKDQVIAATEALDKFIKPSKKDADDELELYKLRYELNLMSAWDYENYLRRRLDAAKKGTAEELKVYKELQDELSGLLKTFRPEIKEDFNFASEVQEKLFKKIKDEFERQGIPWDNKAKALVLNLTLATKSKTDIESLVPDYLKKTTEPAEKTPLKKAAKLTPEQEKVVEGFKRVSNIAEYTGDVIVDAFTRASMSIKDVIVDLGIMALKIAAVTGIKAGLAAIIPGYAAFLSAVPIFHGGGVVGQPTQLAFANPAAFVGAKRYHSGKDVPAILQSDEVVYTGAQHKTLMSALLTSRSVMQNNGAKNVFVFKNLLDGQKFIQENMNKHRARIR